MSSWASIVRFFRSLFGRDSHRRDRLNSQGTSKDDPAVPTNPRNYPWFETVNGGGIEQGDLLLEFDVVVPVGKVASAGDISVAVKTLDLVVMTQTCDIEHGNVTSLLLCPCWNLWQFVDAAKAKGDNWSKERREDLRRGNVPGYHLLNEAAQDGLDIGFSIVDFHEVYTAPAEQVKEFAQIVGKRLRLCPPYKEHLGQAFARFFMRVGLPIDIPKEKLKQRPN